MSAQIGYYDTLKSVAGKVFSYLASITLTGTDGKTITCTQDTSLDEAVAMSSKAPKTATIAGDGVAGRVLRMLQLRIEDGTGANTVKCTLYQIWNGDSAAAVDNIAKNATTGIFSLDVSGYVLTLLNTGVTGDAVAVSFSPISNTSNLVIPNVSMDVTSGIRFIFQTAAGAVVDITTINTGSVDIKFEYITNA